jgi:hypothetical protein
LKEAEEEPEDTNMDMKEAIIQMMVLSTAQDIVYNVTEGHWTTTHVGFVSTLL